MRTQRHFGQTSTSAGKTYAAAILIAISVLLVYGQTLGYGFVNYDDPDYVTGNPTVLGGLTFHGLEWAFSTVHVANWIPLTWLSHMLDVQLYGVWSGGHHFTNLLLHLSNSLLVLFLLKRLTANLWRSAVVALVFAVHPMHVESVAWIAERKDLLSALFWLLALWAYLRYLDNKSIRWYAAIVVLYCLGFMAKPMIVTLPMTLLLLDVWPLKRLAAGLKPLIWEKLPLFALSGVMAIATYLFQRHGGAVIAAAAIPLPTRLGNGATAYMIYLGQLIWPHRLSVFYPYDLALPSWKLIAAFLVLAAVSAFCAYMLKRREYLMVGWLWFVITLVPVIGLLQVGVQAHADRYVYIPMVGILIGIVWALCDLAVLHAAPAMIALAGVTICASLGTKAYFQATNWRDCESLFASAIGNTSHNYVAYNGLGLALRQAGKPQEAIRSFESALRINPEYPDALINISDSLIAVGNPEEAIKHLDVAIRINPASREARVNLGSALLKLERNREAIPEYEKAVALDPEDAAAYAGLGKALAADGQFAAAAANLHIAIAKQPGLADAHYSLGLVLVSTAQMKEAIAEFATAVSLDPNNPDAHYNLGTALGAEERLPEAILEFQAALRLNPSFAAAHLNLGKALANRGEIDQALHEFILAQRLLPGSKEAAEAIQTLDRMGTRPANQHQ